jgi:hypothetical protein
MNDAVGFGAGIVHERLRVVVGAGLHHVGLRQTAMNPSWGLRGAPSVARHALPKAHKMQPLPVGAWRIHERCDRDRVDCAALTLGKRALTPSFVAGKGL